MWFIPISLLFPLSSPFFPLQNKTQLLRKKKPTLCHLIYSTAAKTTQCDEPGLEGGRDPRAVPRAGGAGAIGTSGSASAAPRGAENGRTEALRPLLEMERAWGSRRWEGCGCPFLVSPLLLRAPLSLPIDLSCILSCGLPSPVSCREGDASSLLFFSSIIFRFLLYISRPLFCLSLHFFFFFPLFFSLSAD